MDKYIGKCKLHQDKLLINGKSYSVDTFNDLPNEIDVANSCQKLNSETIAFFGPHSIFSNMHLYGFELNGVYYKSCEHYIQAKKAELFNDDAIKSKILNEKSLFEAKRLRSKVRNYNHDDWKTKATGIATDAVAAKLEVINKLIIQHQTDMEFKSNVLLTRYEVADHLDRKDIMHLLKAVLNNCVFSFQGKFYKQLHGAAMGSPCSPVVANMYMEYFEKRALGPELPMSFIINTWLRYVDDVLTIVKKGTHHSPLNHLNSIDPNIKFIIEPPNEQGATPFLDTFPRPSGNNNKIITSVYRKPTHMDRCLNFNSNHPKSAKHAVVRALTDRAKNVCSSPELLAEEMDHLGKVLCTTIIPTQQKQLSRRKAH